MLKWALIFLVVSVVAYVLGASGVAAGAFAFASTLFWIFLAITVVLFIVGLVTGRKTTI